jgi:hypothetical protein
MRIQTSRNRVGKFKSFVDGAARLERPSVLFRVWAPRSRV